MPVKRWSDVSAGTPSPKPNAGCIAKSSDRDAEPPQGIADCLPDKQPFLPPCAFRFRAPRGPVHIEAAKLEHLFHTEDMVRVTHHDAGLQVHASHDLGSGSRTVHCAFP